MKRLLELGLRGPEEHEAIWDDLYAGQHYDRDGEPLTMRQWGMLMEDPEYQVLKQDHVGPYFVSTVWLGIDHGFHSPWFDAGNYRPIIFETMVFKEEGDEHEGVETERYATEAQAFAGHKRLCAEVRLILEATT